MLPRSRKLLAREVREILKAGASVRSPHVLAKYKPATSTKAAAVVSKKIAKTAVVRNKIRRSMYRALASSLPPRVHVVFMVLKKTDDFSSDIKTICSKLS